MHDSPITPSPLPEFTPVPKGWPKDATLNTATYSSTINWPKISIIIPSYQQANYLEDCILSILHQNYPSIEILVADGGSTDASKDILQAYNSQLTWWVSEKDQGQSDAINKAYPQATGDIVNWLCSDDMLLPNALYAIATAFLNPEVKVVCAWSRQFYEQQDLGLSKSTLYVNWGELLFTSHICQPAHWWRKKIFDTLQPVNIKLHYAMDSELWISFLLQFGKNAICEIPQVVTAYRYHEGSKTVKEDFRFAGDKIALWYSVLYLFNAPKFVLNWLKPLSNSNLWNKIKINNLIYQNERTSILLFYSTKLISQAKIQHKYFLALRLLIWNISLAPFRSLYAWKKLVTTVIAPKLFS